MEDDNYEPEDLDDYWEDDLLDLDFDEGWLDEAQEWLDLYQDAEEVMEPTERL